MATGTYRTGFHLKEPFRQKPKLISVIVSAISPTSSAKAPFEGGYL